MMKKRLSKKVYSRSDFGIRMKQIVNSKRSMEMEEIGKILLAVFILVILIFGVWLLVKGKGGDALAAIKNMLRFGR